jgi:HTH domain
VTIVRSWSAAAAALAYGDGPCVDESEFTSPASRTRIHYRDVVAHPLLDAVRPLADAIGGRIVEPADLGEGDIPLEWGGAVVGGVRLTTTWRDIDWYVGSVERQLGAPLAQLDREDKQRAVKLLNDRGAFGLRRSVEQVAEAMGVSRFTVYNYLNRPEALSRPETLDRSEALNRPEAG